MKYVICCIPGTGKSTLFKQASELGLAPCFIAKNEETGEMDIARAKTPGIPVFDSDSSLFDKSAFPGNYINHIQNVLNTFENVVILVSSHDNVREALREAGIEYRLVFPQLELKADYIERYKNRGSSEFFVNLMEEKWVEFIESCLNDPIPGERKGQLSEGAYLVDYFKLLQAGEVAGQEDNADHVGATIIDVNANAADDVVVVVHTEPTTNPEATLLNVPEGQADATLDALEAQASQPAADPDNSDPQVHGNEGMDLPEVTEVVDPNVTPHDEFVRSELIEAKLDMQNDLDTLEGFIERHKEAGDDAAGMEQFADGSEILTAAAADIKKRYEIDVEPTVAGMEGFLESLKVSYDKITKLISGKASRQDLALIKKGLWQGWKAFEQYNSAEWQKNQTFINVGKTKIQVPDILAEINSPADVKTIVDLIASRVETSYKKLNKNATARVSAGVKIFNKFKGVAEDTPVSEGDSYLPIQPELIKDGISDSGLDKLNVKFKGVEVPVLTKDHIKDVADIAYVILQQESDMSDKTYKVSSSCLEEEDFYRSKFWDKHLSSNLAGATLEACAWEYSLDEMFKLEKAYQEKMLNILKFLESWILHSVK